MKERKRSFCPGIKHRGCTIEEFLRVMSQVDFAEGHQQVDVTPQPRDIAAVERDVEVFRSLGRYLIRRRAVELGEDLPECLLRIGLAVAVEIEPDLAEMDGKLDSPIVHQG